jgi:hypothetical protein
MQEDAMQSSAKISCMTTSFDDKNLELRAFPNGFMSGESKTIIEGIKVQENTMVIAKAFDFEKNNLPSNVVKEIEKNQKNRLSVNGIIMRLEESKRFARNAKELSNIQRRIDDLIANNDSIEK